MIKSTNRILMLITLAWLLAIGSSWGAGTCDVSEPSTSIMADTAVVTVTCTADAADASFPDVVFATKAPSIMTELKRGGAWQLTRVVTLTGTTAPTAASDLALQITVAGKTFDVLCGAGEDMIDATTVNDFYPQYSNGDYRYWPVTDDFTQVISGNAVNSAQLVIQYIFLRGNRWPKSRP